jgi:hypothetical protein
MKKYFIVLTLFFASLSHAELIATGNRLEDAHSTFKLFYRGAVDQFRAKNNLYYAGAAVAPLWYSFDQDKRLSDLARSKKMNKAVEIVGELGVVVAFPALQWGVYELARNKNNTHLMQFMMEYTATVYMVLIESALLSVIDIHERPETSETNFWEKAFRGNSSFPSGHMVPYAALAFKTLQFYGPWWSIAPFGLTAMASLQRVQDGKHYTSDVVGSFFLAAFASEGVRLASQYRHNHPFYQWLYEREAQVSFIQHEGVLGPALVFKF